MLSQIAQRLAYFFVKKNIIRREDEAIYAYGYEIMIAECLNWFITIIIALLSGYIIETIFYMFPFMRLRGALGGYHAKTHMGCILLSTTVYTVCILIVHYTSLYLSLLLMVVCLLVHIILVFTLAPVEHPNKPFVNENEVKKFRSKSYRLTVIYTVICICLVIMQFAALKRMGYCVLLGMLSASVSMTIEHFRQRQEKIREEV